MHTEWLMPCWLLGLTISTGLIVYTDCRWYWIPDSLVVVTAVINGLALWGGLVAPDWSMSLGVAFAMALLYMVYPRGMGSGDVKLTAALVTACSGQTAYAFIVLAFSSAAVIGALVFLIRRQGMLPFGPFLWLGWWLSWWRGEAMLQWLGW